MPSDLLRDNVVLGSFMHHLLGADSFETIQGRLREVREGFDEEDRSYYAQNIATWEGGDPRILCKLREYDEHILSYVRHINTKRTGTMPITLKYFQYLAILYTEIYLDRYFNDRKNQIAELNRFALKHYGSKFTYTPTDFRKIAYWMATGSGKTLILHINILQWLHYNRGPDAIPIDKILLITTSESLSAQHLDEMKKSGIPAEMYQTGYFAGMLSPETVHIIDINKLYDQEKERENTRNKLEPRNPKNKGSSGGGVRVDVRTIGSHNLILVDEGHVGSSGKVWRELRDKVSENGFTFEYSATFGQAIRKKGGNIDKDLLRTYGRAIIFNYSYPYFYGDYFGKDFRLLNLERSGDTPFTSEFKHLVLLANLLTFYEQRLIYDTYPDEVAEYNLDAPLWIFVGRTVQLSTALNENIQNTSDILEVLRFLHAVLANEGNRIVETMAAILDGRSGLVDQKLNRDLFARNYPETRLAYLRERMEKDDCTAEDIYKDILSRLFHTSTTGSLQIADIKKARGEIGLRCATSSGNPAVSPYFGIINIGDTATFLDAVQAEIPEIQRQDDEFTPSLFTSVAYRDSPTNVLIGAKKFSTGWNSYRVSCMGLINVGQNAGTEIVQTFGRGVRLRGKNFSLKRSAGSGDVVPSYIPALETLHVFGIGADYMEIFKTEMGEDLPPEPKKWTIPTTPSRKYLEYKLLIPRFSEAQFISRRVITPDPSGPRSTVQVDLDLRPQVETYQRTTQGTGIGDQTLTLPIHIKPEYLDMLNWTRIYFELMDYRNERGWYNMVFGEDTLRAIMDAKPYTLICPAAQITPRSYEDLWKIEQIVISILKKYLLRYYNKEVSQYAKETVDVQILDAKNRNMTVTYTIQAPSTNTELIANLQQLIEEGLKQFNAGEGDEFNTGLKNVHIEQHLYQPLLALSKGSPLVIQPTGLQESEQKFIMNLRTYLEQNPQILDSTHLFVIRNRVKSGVKFFETVNFYPDFIIWAVCGKTQHLLFVDPHGLGRINSFKEEKIELSTTIKTDYEPRIQERLMQHKEIEPGTSVYLDSAIIAAPDTPKAVIKQNFGVSNDAEYNKNHVFFPEDENYIEKLLGIILDTN
ncbi:DEAD/DEAH box helicase family protein [Methanofollis ethanolicus]|jgi:hypothetical protein|uniref:DEAD/DEAH box helicase family protein n=1 Tax=Methanofollis ethanolicus TaxID=488124 RepID=UPI000831CB3D|nr:DEAD/DEAH box helicase family protein [Methanofollis ethanolicus]